MSVDEAYDTAASVANMRSQGYATRGVAHIQMPPPTSSIDLPRCSQATCQKRKKYRPDTEQRGHGARELRTCHAALESSQPRSRDVPVVQLTI
jgi:hypothetical protein